jgi:hypothetical protein
LIEEEFDINIEEFEETLQRIMGAVASGSISEKLSPSHLLQSIKTSEQPEATENKTEKRQLSLSSLEAEQN